MSCEPLATLIARQCVETLMEQRTPVKEHQTSITEQWDYYITGVINFQHKQLGLVMVPKRIIQLWEKNKAQWHQEIREVNTVLVQALQPLLYSYRFGPMFCLLHKFLPDILPCSYCITVLYFCSCRPPQMLLLTIYYYVLLVTVPLILTSAKLA